MNDEPLANRTITATFEQDNGSPKNYWVIITFVVKNLGESSTGRLYFKLYTKDKELELDNISGDEPGYQCGAILDPESMSGSREMPGKMARAWHMDMPLKKGRLPNPGYYDAMIKAYYGRGLVVGYPLKIIVPSNPIVAPYTPN